MANRLKLDFKLQTNEERVAFLTEYLQQPQFATKPPTEDELEMMGNYILWGKDPQTGLNVQQEGLLSIDTKHGTWDKSANVDSLDELMELPGFNEASVSSMDAVPIKVKKETFSRKEALAKCPEYLKETMERLFRHIDECDLLINYYELAHGKRTNPPRPELLATFTAAEQQEIEQAAAELNQFQYLKKRHLLVELRREQYTLRDSYRPPIIATGIKHIDPVDRTPMIGSDIEVLPLGLCKPNPIGNLVFICPEELLPGHYTDEELKRISDYYWSKKNWKPNEHQDYIDFRELEHVYQIFMAFFELEDAAGADTLDNSIGGLLDTLKFYVERAELSEMYKEILDLKMKKVRNSDIASQINAKWGKTYTPNYISTIFRQRIIPKINDAAAYHEQVVSNLFFEEEFKTCTCCGRTLLKCADNFTRKARSKDGFTTRCKKCEKIARNK